MKKFFIPLSIALSCQLHSVAQNIGIGTTSPTQKLTVNGAIKIGTTATWDTGSIRWNSVKKDFEGFVGDRWLSFTGGKSQWGNIEQYSYESGGIMAGHAWDTSFGHPFSYSDGRLVIAAPKKKTNLHDNAGWVRTSKLYSDGAWGNIDDIYSPAPGNDFQFGYSVSINYGQMVVGEPGATAEGHTKQGKAYIYRIDPNNNEVGQPQEILQSGEVGAANDRFGSAAQIAYDYVVISAPGKNNGANSKQGRVYSFRRLYILGQPTDAFVPESNFTAADGTTDMQFGSVLELTPYCLAVGAPDAIVGGTTAAGKVYIYRRNANNNGWSIESTLISPQINANNRFGTSISMNVLGDTIVIGEPRSTGLTGRVHVYVKNGMNWELRSTISAQSTDDWDGFGCSVDFNYGKILIGAKDAQVGINHQQGKAYLYSQSGTSWVREALFTPMTGESSLQFGATVHWGLSNMAIVGAPGYVNRYFYTEKGRVYWFINH